MSITINLLVIRAIALDLLHVDPTQITVVAERQGVNRGAEMFESNRNFCKALILCINGHVDLGSQTRESQR